MPESLTDITYTSKINVYGSSTLKQVAQLEEFLQQAMASWTWESGEGSGDRNYSYTWRAHGGWCVDDIKNEDGLPLVAYTKFAVAQGDSKLVVDDFLYTASIYHYICKIVAGIGFAAGFPERTNA